MRMIMDVTVIYIANDKNLAFPGTLCLLAFRVL